MVVMLLCVVKSIVEVSIPSHLLSLHVQAEISVYYAGFLILILSVRVISCPHKLFSFSIP